MDREMPRSQFSTGPADIRMSQPQHLEQSHRVERSVQRPRGWGQQSFQAPKSRAPAQQPPRNAKGQVRRT